jgi:hypothetical protein
MPGKRVQFDQETWNALDLLARDSMQDFQELADEAAGRSTSRRPCGRAWATSRNARRRHRSDAATHRGRLAGVSENVGPSVGLARRGSGDKVWTHQ